MIDDLIRIIHDLPLKEALALLITKKVFDFSKEGYEKVKKLIQDKYNEGKYAFVPNKEEARQLLQFRENPDYKEVLLLVPNYRYIDLVRTGLLIDYYHKNDSPQNRERVKSIKSEISRRPNGKKLLHIVNLPTTPFFSVILHVLYEFKRKGYSNIFLEERFDEMVNEWEESSEFVTSDHTTSRIISFCKNQMDLKKETFFLLGMKHASKILEEAINEMDKERVYEEKGYDYKLTKSLEGNQPRIEVIVFIRNTNL